MDKRKFSDRTLINWLKFRGYVAPKTESDVDDFEMAMQDHEVPSIPCDIDDPNYILFISDNKRALLSSGFTDKQSDDIIDSLSEVSSTTGLSLSGLVRNYINIANSINRRINGLNLIPPPAPPK